MDVGRVSRLPIISKTTGGKVAAPRLANIDGLIVNTAGYGIHPSLQGVITRTSRGAGSVKDSVMSGNHGEHLEKGSLKTATHPRTLGQVPFAGRKY
jgi:hypothetical protein